MNIMNTPKFIIKDLLKNSNKSLDILKNELYSKNIKLKEYKEDNLILIYNNYDIIITFDVQRECRSLVVDSNTFEIISYSCETPLLNNEGYEYLKNTDNYFDNISICYEGAYLSIFNCNDKWYIATRKDLQNQNSIIKSKQYDMFIEVLKLKNYESFEDFCKTLDTNKSYYYTLIHYKNKNIIDYTNIFGLNYTKLCLSCIRDNEMQELNIYENPLYSNNILEPIFISNKENFNYFLEYNKIIENIPSHEGIIIRSFDNTMNKYRLIKIQFLTYQYHYLNSLNANSGLLFLYQNNQLYNYLHNNNTMKYIKINNIFYNTISIVDSVFKTLSTELNNIYNILWDINSGLQKYNNNNLYQNLSKYYKEVLYNIRGIYFKNKKLNINDIYNYLKKIDTTKIINLLKSRNILNNNNSILYDIFCN